MDCVFTIAGTITGGLIGGVLAPYLNYKWNSRLKEREIEVAREARQLDFYKTIYPERFKVAKELLVIAGNVFKYVSILDNQPNNQSKIAYQHQCHKDFLLLSNDIATHCAINEWLLSKNICELTIKFNTACRNFFYNWENEAHSNIEILYQQLSSETKLILHIDEHEQLLA